MEEIAEIIDRIENLVHALKIPVGPELHFKALKDQMPEIHKDLKAAYLKAGGEDHWPM